MTAKASEQQIRDLLDRVAAGESPTAASIAVGLNRSYSATRRSQDPDFSKKLRDAQDSFLAGRAAPPSPESPEQAAAEKLEVRRAEIARDQAAVTAVRADLKKVMAQYDSVKEIKSVLRDVITQVKPVPFRVRPPVTDKPTHEWVLNLSDWHIGQYTSFEETGGLYEQSTEIALGQVQTLWDVVALVHDIESTGRELTKLHIFSLGDMVDGDLMRVSQTRKIDKTVAEQYPLMYALMEALVIAALTKFDTVEVHVVGGNHDRFGKFGDAGLGELAYIDNWSYVMGTHLESAFEAEPRVDVHNHQSFFGTAIVAGWKFAFSHGSDVNWRSNSYAGIPYYSLNVAAEKMKAMVDGFDVLMMGHGHIPMHLPVGEDSHVIMNGSLPGTSSYVQSRYKSIRRPSQTLISMHHRVGMTGYHRLYLDHEGMRDAADLWTRETPPTAHRFDLTADD
jgi:predicted phosphodiesterase